MHSPVTYQNTDTYLERKMAYATERVNGWSGMYRTPDGRRKSAGLYPTEEQAIAAAEKAEGRPRKPDGETAIKATKTDRNRSLRLREHVTHWLVNETELMPSTLRGYEKQFRTHILPALGDRTVASLKRADVEKLMAQLRREGVPAWTQSQCKAALGRSLRPLVGSVLEVNPSHGVRIFAPPPRDFDLLAYDEALKILKCLPTDGARAFATFLINTGARFGEAAEIRLSDINIRSQEVRIARRVILAPAASLSRYAVVQGTKAGQNRARSVPIPTDYLDALRDWAACNNLGPQDLLFPEHLVQDKEPPRPVGQPDPGQWFYRSNRRRYQHGTANGYHQGKCTCRWCRLAARNDAAGRPAMSSVRRVNDSGHLPHDTWRKTWRQAIDDAGLDWYPRTHDLRHAYATHLLAGGLDIYSVKDQMGHQQIATTMKYLHKVESQRNVARDIIQSWGVS
jgi:integrase